MKMMLIISLIFCTHVALSAQESSKTKVGLKEAKKSLIEKTLFFPVQIKSRVDSKIKSDGDYIVIDRVAKLGQQVKKNDPLIVLRHQDTSVYYENRILRSPVDGIVAAINVEKGQFIHKMDEIIYINDPTALYAKIEVSASDYKNLTTNLEGKINIPSLKLEEIPVKVQAIGTAADSLTGTISVELSIEKEMEKLVSGVIGLAEITLDKQEKLIVNEKALYYIGDDILIATIDKNNEVKKVKVKTGERIRDNIEILDGLELDTKYVFESAKFLRDGEEVEALQ